MYHIVISHFASCYQYVSGGMQHFITGSTKLKLSAKKKGKHKLRKILRGWGSYRAYFGCSGGHAECGNHHLRVREEDVYLKLFADSRVLDTGSLHSVVIPCEHAAPSPSLCLTSLAYSRPSHFPLSQLLRSLQFALQLVMVLYIIHHSDSSSYIPQHLSLQAPNMRTLNS
ncbi:hypothetical protein EX30DRAFT_366069 [Ascodesmis nigricans]|uniref:Uncharacterized protein n=1 Tax=Ascodesmis nigricans TaxID=341454 RepID=A0A4S2MME8_9PEZI|nr:hypothetical protein EX30DRAFT_366069 [Ascodesmis nigricans]